MASLPAEKHEAKPVRADAGPSVQEQNYSNWWSWTHAPKQGDYSGMPLTAFQPGEMPYLLKGGYCVKDGVIERLPVEKSWGAFEPFFYAERN